VHPVRAAEERQVEVVVDDEERTRFGCQIAEPPRELQQGTSGELLVSQLQDVGAAAQGRRRKVGQVAWVLVWGDDVEARGTDLVEEVLSRGLANLGRSQNARAAEPSPAGRCAFLPKRSVGF
jgi:hypothetical protein